MDEDGFAFGRDNTIEILLKSGASRVTTCSSPFEGQTLITVAFRVADPMRSFGAIAVLIEACYELNENNLDQFDGLRREFSARLHHDSNICGLESLALSLSPRINKSTVHFILCRKVWALAVEAGFEFARDPDIVDTRISFSKDALAMRIISSVSEGDVPTLIKVLGDPRANITALRDDDDMTIFQIWLTNLHKVGLWEGLAEIRPLLCAGMEVN